MTDSEFKAKDKDALAELESIRKQQTYIQNRIIRNDIAFDALRKAVPTTYKTANAAIREFDASLSLHKIGSGHVFVSNDTDMADNISSLGGHAFINGKLTDMTPQLWKDAARELLG